MHTDPLDADTDDGGRSDGAEVNDDGTDPLDGHDDLQDSDGDGLTDAEELDLGTDPFDTDSDDGGVSDGDEVANGTDPNDGTDDSPDTDDTGETGETGETGDTGETGETDVPLADGYYRGGACGCATGGTGGVSVGLLALLLLVRRRMAR